MKVKKMSAADYAKLRGHSKSWVSRQIAAGMPAEGVGRSGAEYRIDTALAIEWEIQKAGIVAEIAPGSERERLVRAQAVKFELENSRRRKELVLVAYVESIFHGMAADITARLDAISGRLANEFPGTDPGTVKAKIRAETDAVRTGVAQYFEKIAESAPPEVPETVATVKPATKAKKRRRHTKPQLRHAQPKKLA